MRASILFPAAIGVVICPALCVWVIAAQTPTSHPDVTPGLWEIQTISKMSGAGLPPAMANAMNHTTTFRSCVTQQNINESFGPEQRNSCVRSNEEMSSNRYSTDFKCGDGSTGHFEVIFDSTTSAHSSMRVDNEAQGRSIHGENTSTGKYLGASCGSVKPGHPQMVH